MAMAQGLGARGCSEAFKAFRCRRRVLANAGRKLVAYSCSAGNGTLNPEP